MDESTETALVIRPATGAELAPLVDLEAAEDFARAAIPTNTARAYRGQWQAFADYCTAAGVRSLPATPETVAAYIARRATAGSSVATIEQALAAIAKAHLTARHDTPTTSAEVSLTRRGIRRRLGVAPTRKAAATLPALERMVGALTGRELRVLRDRALMLVGMAGGFRRGELVALEVSDVEDDPQARGVQIRVRRGKTDQEGRGHVKAIPFGSRPDLDPAGALRAWLRAAGITHGPVFRSVDRYGHVRPRRLDGRDVARIVKAAATAAGLDPSGYAGHSLRRGFVTQAALDGKDTRTIIRQTRQTERTAHAYIDTADPFAENAVVGMF